MMKDSKRIGFTKWELLVVLCIFTALSSIYIDKTRNPKGPIGRKIPKTAPREENRISHFSGLSLVAPPNWDNNLGYEPELPTLSIAPRVGLWTRHQRANLKCQHIPPPQTEKYSEYISVDFQGFPAYERMYVRRTDTFETPASSEYALFINRDGEWWKVAFLVADEMTELPEIMREYINTIRFPPKADEEKKNEVEPGVND